MINYENLLGEDPALARYSAEKIIESGWANGNYPLVQLTDIPWDTQDHSDRSWSFRIHAWRMLDSILKAFSSTRNSKYLTAATAVAIEWCGQFSDYDAPGLPDFAWYDMAVGLRAYRLAYIIDMNKAMSVDLGEDADTLWLALLRHQEYLSDDKNITFHNNHGLYQVAGQLAMARRFGKLVPSIAEAGEQGLVRLEKMLAQQFTPEGVHREHSPGYHLMVYKTLKEIIASGLIDRPNIVEFSRKIEEALSWLVLPSGHLVNFGDTDFESLSCMPELAIKRWVTSKMQYVTSNGVKGSAAYGCMVYEEGGYFIARQRDKKQPGNFKRASYLAQIAAFHSRTHKHADDLSFVWAEKGQLLLTDAGRYGYPGKVEQGSDLWMDGYWYSDPNRVYCESTRAHNTLEFDGRNYERRGVKPYGSALKRHIVSPDGIIAIETECKHFGSIRHVRVLIFSPGEWLLVFDWFHDNYKEKRTARQWFHLGHHLELSRDTEGLRASIPGSEVPLRIASFNPEVSLSKIFIGQVEPQMQGWWSPKEKEIIPTHDFCFEQHEKNTGVFATLFCLSNSLSSDPEDSRFNVSGRNAQFKWNDDRGFNAIRFNRSMDEKLSVAYSKSEPSSH